MVLAVAFLLVSSQTIAAQRSGAKTKDDKTPDIVGTIYDDGKFSTLVKALQAAGLVDELKSKKGKFTLFAPTNEAFAKLPTGTMEDLLRPENKEKLRAILLYHILKGKVESMDVSKLNGKDVTTLQGGTLKIDTTSGVKINNSTVVKADVIASNGIIHVIDTVLIPAS